MSDYEWDDPRWEWMVLINHEEQHSLWPTFKDIPRGWTQVGPVGSKQECLDYVEKAWPDITPLSVRKQLEANKEERERKLKKIQEEQKHLMAQAEKTAQDEAGSKPH
ncbi:MbtH family NRPS accessory protein [Roseibium sp. RKSG952]|uniref:MbtH family NRPS accessory protein n=1 Tax=Roseibium sp. RKSG952 TaxID=2529384 RepID=UPI0012BC8875|nr:MbtH family NRPS accessory protein [Roseibium sp. RKSG952]